MSKLAQQLANSSPTPIPSRPGPRGQCFDRYGPGDLEDWQALDTLRRTHSWREVQAHIDQLVGVTQPLDLEKFRYHWRRRCYCWPADLRL